MPQINIGLITNLEAESEVKAVPASPSAGHSCACKFVVASDARSIPGCLAAAEATLQCVA